MFYKLIELPLHEEWIDNSCLLAALSLFCLGSITYSCAALFKHLTQVFFAYVLSGVL